MTPCLLDADVFIRAKNDYYRFVVCPGFWDWILKAHETGDVCSVEQIREELLALADDLSVWVRTLPSSFFLTIDAQVIASAQQLTTWANSQGYQDRAVNRFFDSADLWLIAHAMARGWRVVTNERSEPNAKRSIKIPDVCNAFGVRAISPYQMLEELGARFIL